MVNFQTVRFPLPWFVKKQGARSNGMGRKSTKSRVSSLKVSTIQRMPFKNAARMGDVGKAVGFPRLTALLSELGLLC
jgi:hypothetical protein